MEDVNYMELINKVNTAVSAYLEDGGDPAAVRELLEEIAEEVCGD